MKEVKKTMNAVKGFILPQCLVRRLSRHLLIGAQCAPNVMSAEQRVVAASPPSYYDNTSRNSRDMHFTLHIRI